MASTWYVSHAALEEDVVPGKRLGRNVRHDSRSLAYRWPHSGVTLANQLWARNIPILDQGDVGSCTGNAETGALGTDPLFGTLPAGHPTLNEAEALKLYSAAEVIDGDGPYPPSDNGSSGLSVAQAAKNAGLISGYVHCLSLSDVLDALQTGPVIIGSNWYTSMDSPDSSGLVTISGSVRGGHEYLCRGMDVAKQLVFLDNSWGTGFGVNGSFSYSWATLTRLLAEQGDATVSVPLTAPAPVPVPPVPTPVPVPPGPGPDTNADDALLAAHTASFAGNSRALTYKRERAAIRAWKIAKGL